MGLAQLETAVLGGGCFWCLEAVFLEVKGVQGVTSGYAGGHLAQPSYEQVCGKRTGHAEVVRVVFDPSIIQFAQLLQIFFAVHDPTTPDRQGADVGPQYRSAIFATTPEQFSAAQTFVAQCNAQKTFGAQVVTQVALLGAGNDRFWAAEPEHQRYFERNPYQGYCSFVVAPKVEKFRKQFAALRSPG
jgi:peptide-methionine (S)-S-oxide reductase